MGHDHQHHDATGQARARPLALALAVTTVFLVVEVAGGLLTGSLALLADAGHMATDAAALALALVAIWLASRPATPRRSFGYRRAEVLAALANAATLVIVSIYVFWEAIRRLDDPPEVESGPMLVVAVAGLAANAVSAWILARGGGHVHDMNTRGAYLHVLGDLLGSAGAIAAALLMLATSWYLADPLLSAGIGLLILRGAWRLLREAVDVLLESTPTHIDTADVRRALGAVGGVAGVHDLHVWTVTSGLVALSGHVELTGDRPWRDVLDETVRLLGERFGIAHVTLQPEDAKVVDAPFRGCSFDTQEGQRVCRALLRAHPDVSPAAGSRHRH